MECPQIYYMEPTMKAFKKAVDAYNIEYGGIEAKKLENNLYAVFNKDRFLANLDPNRRIGDDIIAGSMFIVATNDDKFPVSLSDDQASRYSLRFWNTESFDDMNVVEANLNTLFNRFLKDGELWTTNIYYKYNR